MKKLLVLTAIGALTACSQPKTITPDTARNALQDYLPPTLKVETLNVTKVEGKAPEPIVAHFSATITAPDSLFRKGDWMTTPTVSDILDDLAKYAPAELLTELGNEVADTVGSTPFLIEVFPKGKPVKIDGQIALVTLGKEMQLRTPQLSQTDRENIQQAKPRNQFPETALVANSPEEKARTEALRKKVLGKFKPAQATEPP